MKKSHDPKWLVIAQFTDLEARLCSYMEYVPYVNNNKGVLSPKLPGMLMEACSLIDSVFKHFVNDQKQNGGFKGYVNSVEQWLDLENTTTIFLISPLKFLTPFKGWSQNVPDWWAAYNKIKHDRINSFEAASLENVVMALAGLHQVIVRSRIFISEMVKAGWFNEHSEDLMELAIARDAGCGPPDIPAETKLFVSSTSDDFWEDLGGGHRKIADHWNFSFHVKSLIWEHEDHDSNEEW